MARWTYLVASKTYVDEEGTPLSQDTLHAVRDSYLGEMDALLDAYADNLASGDWSINRFETEMRRRLKDAYVAEYVLGRGGISQMSQADYGRLGGLLKAQYRHLRSYLDDLESGKETKGTAGLRAKNFLGSARQSFSRGRAKAFDIDLPYHPGSGTPCHGNCKCSWDIEEDDTEYRAYWKVSSSKPCAGCLARGAESNPFVQTKVFAE